MTKQIITFLKQRVGDIAGAEAEVVRNVVKEEVQYYVLSFIYHHPKYSKWIMYGGSALRICHGLNRMSVDLDFEIDQKITESFLDKFKKETENYFLKNYQLDITALKVKIVKNRGLLLRFFIGDELKIKHESKQVHVKIDLNNFVVSKVVTERVPVNHNQLSFVIKTYNMSALMASKIAAVLLRGSRGVGKAVYEEKGRDVYDLLWYMEKKIVPDLDYLLAKKIDITDLQVLFARLTIQMNKVSNKNLRQDLSPLFLDQGYINNWLEHWHENYLRLVEAYDIRTIANLQEIEIYQDPRSGSYSFIFVYNTKENKLVKVVYTVSDYWFDSKEGGVATKINNSLTLMIRTANGQKVGDRMRQYATFFNKKNSDYFKKTNNVVMGSIIETKVIRMTADNLNQREQIVLNHLALLSCELEDLMK
ncbi:nucleotidyl transferase AbiEii/AbiGii toxin family protein [Patescibacteria group bacterium]|nr:nucleotidyl transferase AbiEii/AbiGii toxin family protein [Patescibacteria group bacterium]